MRRAASSVCTRWATNDYTIRILAADYAGNAALAGRDLAITVQ